MKDYSVTMIKRSLRGKPVHLEQMPKEGTRVRQLFDLFHAYKGQIIDLGMGPRTNTNPRYKNIYGAMKQLKDAYGMDITSNGKGGFCFHGEYFGTKYVSYVNDKPLKIKVKP
jgi:hypothetical protein